MAGRTGLTLTGHLGDIMKESAQAGLAFIRSNHKALKISADAFENKEIQLKIVYYGPGLSGKTTNLVHIHRVCAPSNRGRLMTLETRDDRTLFFDLLPMHFESASGLTITVKLFTVPGQVIHSASRATMRTYNGTMA